jgi:hypothetical protein
VAHFAKALLAVFEDKANNHVWERVVRTEREGF